MSGCPTTSAQAYEDCGAPAQGLAKYGVLNINTVSLAAAIASSKPAGAPSSYAAVCEAMLRAGGLIYWKTNPGDCPAPPASGGVTMPQVVGLAGSAGSGIAGGLGAIGVISGPATLGIGTVVGVTASAISQIFAAHAQAVANEQATICAVASYFNRAKKQIDAAVASGAISPDAGTAYLIQVCNSAKSGLASIAHACNAACVYQAICQAFINYAHTWYDSIAPTSGVVFAQQPAGAPTSIGTPPGGVAVTPSSLAPPSPVRSLPGTGYAPSGPSASGSVAPLLASNSLITGNPGAVDWLNLGYNQQTGQSAQAADVPNTTNINWTAIGAVASIVLIGMAVFGFKAKVA